MLQALLADKLYKEFNRSPFEVEDLLTSTVLGSCSYAPSEQGLFPFLKKAIQISGHPLALSDYLSAYQVLYEFWPDWREDKVIDVALRGSSKKVVVKGGEPDLLLTLKMKGAQDIWILIEVKLESGKSSQPAQEEDTVSDQLGKYWLQLRERALEKRITPLCIVYLTAHTSPPQDEMDETLDDVRSKTGEEVPLFWLSWRSFDVSSEAETILKDTMTLLREKWDLFPIEPMGKWPAGNEFDASRYFFNEGWVWPRPLICNRMYGHKPSWRWPGLLNENKTMWYFNS